MKSRFKRLIQLMVALMLVCLPFSHLTVQAEEPLKIGILQYVEHEALDAVREGFVETLEDSELGARIELDIQNASGDQSTLQSMSEKIARDNDILFAIATPAAIALATIEESKPIFIAAVTDPVDAGLAKSMEEPGSNVTGTSDMAPIDEQVDLLVRNFPDALKIGLIYNSSEVNSQIQADMAVELLEEAGLETHISTVVSTNDIAQVMGQLTKEVDAIFMVTDNTIDSAIALVGDLAKEQNIPTIGSSEPVVLANGLATLSNSYHDYGVQTAEMVIRMVEEELDPSDMPIELGKDFKVVVNEEFAEAIGVDPDSIK